MRAVTNVLAVARRELASYYSTFLGYIITAAFLFLNGLFFFQTLGSQQATIGPTVANLVLVLIFAAPLLSMRLLAEESRTGTLELLLTAPVRDGEVVLGKFVAALGFLGVMLGLTLVYPLILYLFGKPDTGEVVGGYLVIVLFGAAALAIGLLASSLTQNQIVAALVAFVTMLVLYFIDAVGQPLGGTVGSVLAYLAVYTHLTDMARGVVNTKGVIYYLSLIVGALFLTTRTLEARRWRG